MLTPQIPEGAYRMITYFTGHIASAVEINRRKSVVDRKVRLHLTSTFAQTTQIITLIDYIGSICLVSISYGLLHDAYSPWRKRKSFFYSNRES